MSEGESPQPELAMAEANNALAAAGAAQADALRRRFEMAQAEAVARQVVREFPTYAAGHLILGRVLLATRRLDEALTHFSDAGRLAPDWEDAVAWQIAALSRQRRSDEAVALGRAAREEMFPDSALVWVALGRCYLDSSRPLEAVPHLAEAVRLQPDDMRAVRWYADALVDLFSWAEGDELTQAAVTRNPDSARAHLIRGLFLNDRGYYPAAFRSLDRAYALDPGDPAVLEWRVTVLRYLGRMDAAVDAAADAVGRYPLAPRMHVERAWVLSWLDRDREALACVDEALAIDPGDDWALGTKVYVLRYLERYREASHVAAEALECRADCVDLYLMAARVSRDHDVALGHVHRALALDPRHVAALRYLITRLGNARRFGEAERVAREAAGFHPYDPTFAVALAELYEGPDERRDGECGQALQDALRIDPLYEPALLKRGALLLRTGQPDSARTVYREFLGAFPHDPSRCLEVASCYADAEQYTTAVEYVDKALAIDPSSAAALRRKVGYLENARRLDDAEQTAVVAIARRPDDASMLLRLAGLYYDDGRYRSALAVLNHLPADSYLQAETAVPRAQTLARLGRFKEAVRIISVGSGSQDDPRWFSALGELYKDEKKYQRALEALDHVVRADPEHEDAALSRATLLLKLERWDDADAAFSALVQDGARDAYRCAVISVIYSGEQHYDDAVRYSQRALMVDPGYRTARRNLVYHLALAGRTAEARQAGVRLTQEYPDDPLAHLYVGYVHEELGDYEVGLEYVRQALALDPDLEDALALRFDLLLSLRRYDEARSEVERIAELSPEGDCGDLLDRLAGMAERDGRLELALTCRRRSAELHPQHTEAIVTLAELLTRLGWYRQARPLLEGIRSTAQAEAEAVVPSVSRIKEKPERAVQALAGLYATMSCPAKAQVDLRKSRWRQIRNLGWWRTGGPVGVIRRRLIENDEQVIQQWESWSRNTVVIETLPGMQGARAETAGAEYDRYILNWSRRRRQGGIFAAAMGVAAWLSILAASWALLDFTIFPSHVNLGDLVRAAFSLAVVGAAAGLVLAFNYTIISPAYSRRRKTARIVVVCAVAVALAFLIDSPHDLFGHARASGVSALIRLACSAALIVSAAVTAWSWLISGLATLVSGFRWALFQRQDARSAILDNLLDLIVGISDEQRRNDLAARSDWISLLEEAARRLEQDLPRYYRKLDPATAVWFGHRAAGSARWVRSLKQQVILPGNGSWQRLSSSLHQMAGKVADGDFVGLHWTEPVPVIRERKLVSYARRSLRTLTVMALPAFAVVVTGLIVPLTGGTYRTAALLSLGWAVLYLLLSLDPDLREKIDTALVLFGTARGSAKASSPTPSILPDAGDKRPPQASVPRRSSDLPGRPE